MKTYPSISKNPEIGMWVYAFDKIDGSNIRVEWSKKRGFYKFGTRKKLLSIDEEPLNESFDIFKKNWEDILIKIFLKQNYKKVVCFFEFVGKNSFAGFHEDEEHKLVLLDISPDNKGIFDPKRFLDLFGHLNDIPKLIYEGEYNEEFANSVKSGHLEGLTCEGVVCKGLYKNRLKMFKVKTDFWLEKLKNRCGEDKTLFERLS